MASDEGDDILIGANITINADKISITAGDSVQFTVEVFGVSDSLINIYIDNTLVHQNEFISPFVYTHTFDVSGDFSVWAESLPSEIQSQPILINVDSNEALTNQVTWSINNKTVKSLTINNKEVQSITKNNIIIWEKEPIGPADSISLSSDKNIVSLYDNEEFTLTTTVLDENGNRIRGETVNLYCNDNGSFELVNSMIDNNDGTYELTINSNGLGDRKFYAKIDTLSSDIITIEDCKRVFKLDGVSENYRTFRNSGKSFNNGVLTAKSCVVYPIPNDNSYVVEFDAIFDGGEYIFMPSTETNIDKNWKQIWQTRVLTYYNGSSQGNIYYDESLPSNTWITLKIIKKSDGTCQLIYNGNVIYSWLLEWNTPMAIGVDHYSYTNTKIKNIKIKPYNL